MHPKDYSRATRDGVLPVHPIFTLVWPRDAEHVRMLRLMETTGGFAFLNDEYISS